MPKKQYISAEELKKMIDSNADVIIVDIRTPIEYELYHIPRAINIPLSKFDEKILIGSLRIRK